MPSVSVHNFSSYQRHCRGSFIRLVHIAPKINTENVPLDLLLEESGTFEFSAMCCATLHAELLNFMKTFGLQISATVSVE